MQLTTLLLVLVLALGADVVFGQQPEAPTFPIIEPDMLREIEALLRRKEAAGDLARIQKEAIERSMRSIESPRPVDGLVRTARARSYLVDPTYTATTDVVTPDGKHVVRAGATINPLDYVSMPVLLLFFDARDARQVAMARNLVDHYQHRVRPIATGGSWLELSRSWKRQVYFDQEGRLIARFGIRQVPALVSQQGRALRIDELEV